MLNNIVERQNVLQTLNSLRDALGGSGWPGQQQSAGCVLQGFEKYANRDFHGASDCARRAVELFPANGQAYMLGVSANACFSHETGVLYFGLMAVTRLPEDPWSLLAQGISLRFFGNLTESMAALRKGLKVAMYGGRSPESSNVIALLHLYLGEGLLQGGAATAAEYAEADFHFHAAHQVSDGRYAYSRWYHAWYQLIRGQYNRAAWVDFEDRTGVYTAKPITPVSKNWNGAALDGRTLLLDCLSGGLGDTLQFGRYIPLAKAAGGRVVALVDLYSVRLLPLLESCAAIDQVVVVKDRSQDLPPYDVAVSVMSLPLIFGTTLDTIPSPLWLPDPPKAKSEAARARTEGHSFKIGLSWAASDGSRSMPLSGFAPLSTVPGVRLFALQRGREAGELYGAGFPITNLEGPDTDIMDTASAMLEMDIVISADTMTAHLAGSLGVKTFTIIPKLADWRWLLNRSDSPWYPDTMRLFRQTVAGDWTGPVAEVVESVRTLVDGHNIAA